MTGGHDRLGDLAAGEPVTATPAQSPAVPHLLEDLMICLAAPALQAPRKTTAANPDVDPTAAGDERGVVRCGVRCHSCERRRATVVLTWPDKRFALCLECVSPQLAAVAEPLDDDDDLVLDAADDELVDAALESA